VSSDFSMKREPVIGVIDCEQLQSPINQEVVEYLEDCLQQAKDGKISNMAIAVVRPTGEITTGWTSGDLIPLVAASARLAYRMQGAVDNDG
jgi:hypothetical protein